MAKTQKVVAKKPAAKPTKKKSTTKVSQDDLSLVHKEDQFFTNCKSLTDDATKEITKSQKIVDKLKKQLVAATSQKKKAKEQKVQLNKKINPNTASPTELQRILKAKEKYQGLVDKEDAIKQELDTTKLELKIAKNQLAKFKAMNKLLTKFIQKWDKGTKVEAKTATKTKKPAAKKSKTTKSSQSKEISQEIDNPEEEFEHEAYEEMAEA